MRFNPDADGMPNEAVAQAVAGLKRLEQYEVPVLPPPAYAALQGHRIMVGPAPLSIAQRMLKDAMEEHVVTHCTVYEPKGFAGCGFAWLILNPSPACGWNQIENAALFAEKFMEIARENTVHVGTCTESTHDKDRASCAAYKCFMDAGIL